jgi:hypothetical protein
LGYLLRISWSGVIDGPTQEEQNKEQAAAKD